MIVELLTKLTLAAMIVIGVIGLLFKALQSWGIIH